MLIVSARLRCYGDHWEERFDEVGLEDSVEASRQAKRDTLYILT